MRAALILLLLVSPTMAEDRLAPDNPWFREFEATCRDGDGMFEECQAGVLGAYAEFAGTKAIRCDFAEFWRVRDTKFDTEADMIAVLPWQYGVEAIVQTEGVCETTTEPGLDLGL